MQGNTKASSHGDIVKRPKHGFSGCHSDCKKMLRPFAIGVFVKHCLITCKHIQDSLLFIWK